ncbi:PQQ-binding-like beta-propeller repeat protein [Micromonospora sp. DT233]|uniref:outer membrane protein assembly factor BamB family protein n=1 Tax=Micromonospora sp. DT233 TaxID=3393432 RepID=UPI003CEF80A6
MSVIDLGELRDDVEPDPPARPPRSVGRPLRVALAGALALLALAGSVPAAPTLSALVPWGVGGDFVVLGGRVYVAAPENLGGGGTREMTAYAPPTRAGGDLRPLWRAALPFGAGEIQGQEHGGLVLFTGDHSNGGPETVAVEAASGRQRWRLSGSATRTAGGGLLLFGFSRGEGGQQPIPLRVVDLASGRLRWSAPLGPDRTALHYRGVEIDRVALVGGSGRIEVRDAGSGEVLATREPSAGGLREYQGVQIVADLLLVITGDPSGRRRVTAYGLGGLDRRWELDLAPSQELSYCADLLCAGSPEAGLSMLDPATGRPGSAIPRLQWVVTSRGGRLLVVVGTDQGEADAPAGMPFAVLDAATGRTVAELGRWDLADDWDPDGPLLGTRRTREGGLLVAELDPVRAVTRHLGVLHDTAGDCHSDGWDLVCRRPSGAYGWWRLGG